MMRYLVIALLSFLFILSHAHAGGKTRAIKGSTGSRLIATEFGEFNYPWAMVFLPGGDLLVTEKPGGLYLYRVKEKEKIRVRGVPEVAYGGQGGLGDIILHPKYAENQLVYLSYVESDAPGKKGAVVVRARLNDLGKAPELKDIKMIWKQTPKLWGNGHYSYRMAFGPDGKLFITSGDRQKQAPAQTWDQNLGKVIRLSEDGSVPSDNPFQNKGELAKSFWSLGHRNMLGIAFDDKGRLWTHEMGPRHGDELNLTMAGENHGWPIVSWGDQYSGIPIPDHDERPEFHAPELYWVPTIAPSGLIIYSGDLFPKWKGNAFIGGLRSKTLFRIRLNGDKAREAERFYWGTRIREVEQGPDGAIWILEDAKNGRLIRFRASL